jgi:hypothetical protein
LHRSTEKKEREEERGEEEPKASAIEQYCKIRKNAIIL